MYRIECDNVEVFNTSRMDELPVAEAGLSEQLNEAGSLRFVLVQGHPSYGIPEGMATYVKAYEDDEIIFDGRVLSDTLPTFSGQITYECEGALSFLMDSEVTPSRSVMNKTPQEFFEWCIQQHNADIGNDSKRTFQPGNVTISERNKAEKFQISSYTQTKSAIESNLINVYGGYLKVRYSNGVRYLDWLENYSDSINPQAIVIGQNVIDRAFSNSGEGLYTVLRPVGKNGLLLDTPTIDVFSQAMINKYGRIIKSVSFSDASTKAALQTKAEEFIARIKKTLLCTGSIKMVDMHYLDGTSPKVKLGDRFTNIEGLTGTEMTISALERDFLREFEDSCEFGNEKSLNDDGGRSASAISKATSRAGSAAGMNYKHIIELGDMLEINAEILNMHGDTLTQHYNTIAQQANQITSLSTTVEDHGQRVLAIEGTGVIQNDEMLTQFAGTMRLIRNAQGIVTGIEFVDGTMVMNTDEEGHMVTVGAAIAANSGAVQTIQGSGLWTQRDNITGVCGEFDIVEDPLTHVKSIVIKSGGGMKIRENNVEYGVYHEGNLTGGMIVDKLDDGTVVTKIRGDVIDLSTNDGYASILITQSAIRSQMDSLDGTVSSFIQQTPSMIHAEVGSAVSGFAQSVIEQTASYIHMEVNNAASSISRSVIEQTTEYIESVVEATASGIAWSVIRQTMTNIEQKVAAKSKIYVQWSDPNNGVNEIHEGDVWIKGDSLKTWNQNAGQSWDSVNTAEWRSKYGDKHYVWRNGAWYLANDTSTIVEQDVGIEQTKESIALYARAADINGQRYNSRLEVTAQAIRGEVSTARSHIYSVIEQTATNIRMQVANEVQGLQSSIEQTAESITLSVSAAKSSLWSAIVQTSTNILMRVKSETDGLESKINVEKNRISLVVEGTGSNAAIKPASIVTAINNGASSVVISASHINLDGYVQASQLTSNWLSGQIAALNLVTAKKLSLNSGGTITFAGNNTVLTESNTPDIITGLKVVESGNGYKLQALRVGNANWTDLPNSSFSRATTLGGTWSGSVLTVKASPQNENFNIGFGSYGSHKVDLEITTNGNAARSQTANAIDVPIKLSSLNSGQTAPTSRYTKTLVVAIGSLISSRTVNPGSATKSWSGRFFNASVPATTVNPESNKIGLSQAKVNGSTIQGEVYDAVLVLSNTPEYRESGGHHYIKQTVRVCSADENHDAAGVIMDKAIEFNADLAYAAGQESVHVPTTSDISIGGGTRYTIAPSGNALNSLAQLLAQAYINNDGKGRYVRFPVSVSGVGTKYYYIHM